MAPVTRKCRGTCRRQLLQTEEYFPRDGAEWSDYCHQCLRLERLEQENVRLLTERQRSVEQGLAKIADGSLGAPALAETAELLTNAFGGVKEYALEVRRQYRNSEKGSYGRTRILELVARVITENSKQGGAKRPLEAMTEQELEQEKEIRKKRILTDLRIVAKENRAS
jgi:hypothetical protein